MQLYYFQARMLKEGFCQMKNVRWIQNRLSTEKQWRKNMPAFFTVHYITIQGISYRYVHILFIIPIEFFFALEIPIIQYYRAESGQIEKQGKERHKEFRTRKSREGKCKIIQVYYFESSCTGFPRWADKRAGISKICLLFFTLCLYIPWAESCTNIARM